MGNETRRVDTSHILGAIIELQTAILAVQEYADGDGFEWQSIRDAVERVRSTVAVTEHLSATVHPSEQRRLNDLLSEICDLYHLESGTPIVGPPTDQLTRSVRNAIWTFAQAAEGRSGRTKETTKLEWLAQAMLLVREHPDWADAEIARQVGRDKSTLSRSAEYKAAAALSRGQKSDIPSGQVSVDPDTGMRTIEAYGLSGDPVEMDWD